MLDFANLHTQDIGLVREYLSMKHRYPLIRFTGFATGWEEFRACNSLDLIVKMHINSTYERDIERVATRIYFEPTADGCTVMYIRTFHVMILTVRERRWSGGLSDVHDLERKRGTV